MPYNRAHREPEVFAEDTRPGADGFVYCKGCGKELEGRGRVSQPRARVSFMMCEPCREFHGHDLMPKPGSPTFCYRCGGKDEVFIGSGIAPITYHVCPRCVPERAARYRAHDFETPERVVEEIKPAATA